MGEDEFNGVPGRSLERGGSTSIPGRSLERGGEDVFADSGLPLRVMFVYLFNNLAQVILYLWVTILIYLV